MNHKRRWRSRLACQWSALKLFPELEDSTLFPGPDSLPHEFQDHAYLWTWTYKEAGPRGNAALALAVWRPHAKWLLRTGKKLLRALERGGKKGSYHIHAITHQRWDINEIRKHAESCGFGRINVKVIPRSQVGYVAKYLGKPGRFPIPRGTRLWACIGYTGVRQNDIKCHVTELTIPVKDTDCPLTPTIKRWTLDGQTIGERIVRPADYDNGFRNVHIMNITKETLGHIANCIASGAILAVAEYRTCTVRKIEFAEEDKKGNLTGKQVVRKLCEHGVELGNEQITVSQWLPDTFDLDKDKVTPPADKGQPVLVEVDQFSKRYGITAKSIRSLANFDGKLK